MEKDNDEDEHDENSCVSDETLKNQIPAPRRSKRLLEKQIASAKSSTHFQSPMNRKRSSKHLNQLKNFIGCKQ